MTALIAEQPIAAHNSAIPLVLLRNIQKHFGSLHALRGASVEVSPEEMVALVDDNGAGKSTLVKVMAGVYTADSGDYLLERKPVQVKKPTNATALGIRTVYQDLSLCSNLDAVQNLFLVREKAGPWWGDGRMRLGNLSLTRPVGAMSGGQRQNIAIAQSILETPKVVILDEPTAALSHSAAEVVSRLIRTLAYQSVGVVIVSHDIQAHQRSADRDGLRSLLFGLPYLWPSPARAR